MKILLVGGTGTIGGAVAEALSAEHEVIVASRSSEVKVDLSDKASIAAMFETVGKVDAIVSAAGSGAFGPLEALSDEDFAFGLGNKFMGQANLVRLGQDYLNDGGQFVLTSGIMAEHPMPASVLITTLNCAVQGFASAAALGLPRGLKLNVVSPPLVLETAIKFGWGEQGMPAADAAQLYVKALASEGKGEVIRPA